MKSVRYWHTKSPQLQAFTSLVRLLAGQSTVALQDIESGLSISDKKEALQFVERTIGALTQVLGAKGLSEEKIDLVRLEMGALVTHRVRLYAVARFVIAAEKWLELQKPAAISIWPSGHFTDWLLYAVCKERGIKLSPFSYASAALARVLMVLSDRRVYRPRVFKPALSHPSFTPQVIFVATMETHAKNLIPLMREALKEGKSVGLLVSSGFKEWKSRKDIPPAVMVANFRDFITGEDVEDYGRKVRAYAPLFKEHASVLRATSVFRSINVGPILYPGLKDFYTYVLPQNALYVRLARRVLSYQPAGILCSRVLRGSETAFMALAQQRRVPSALALHGFVTDEPDFYYGSGRFDLVDCVYVWNQAQKNHVARKVGSRTEVVIEANPQWESALGVSADKNQVLARAGFTPEAAQQAERLVTFTVQQRNGPVLWRRLIETAGRHPHTLLVIKTHPTVPKERILALVPSMPPNVVVVDESTAPLYPLLHVSDVLVSVSSTTLFEAAVLGTPALLYRAHSFDFVDELAGYGLPVIADEAALEAFFSSSDKKADYWSRCAEFRKRYLDSVDARAVGASRRILEAVIGRGN